MTTESGYDAHWKLRAQRGNKRAVGQLVDEMLDPLFRFCFYRVNRNRELCEEVVQETLVRAIDELPKYDPPIHNEKICDPFDEWLYFLRFASTSTAEELAERLVDQEFAQATGVLEMIAKTPSERALYEARLKFQRDERARLLYAEQNRTHQQQQRRQKGEGELETELHGNLQTKCRPVLRICSRPSLTSPRMTQEQMPRFVGAPHCATRAGALRTGYELFV